MTDQRSEELSTIVITEVTEHEDGSATYTFDMDDASSKKMAELGIELILTCAAYGLDIQDALQVLMDYGKEFGKEPWGKERSDEIDGPYTADDIEKEFGNGTDNT